MAKTAKKKVSNSVEVMKNKIADFRDGEKFENGLTDALLGNINPLGFGVQLSQTTTIFANLRWYMISNQRQTLSQAYVEIGLIQTLIDVPVDDGLRGGIEIKTKQLAPDQITELLAEMEEEDDLTHAGEAAKWNRLFGGAAILILTDQKPELPLNMDTITEKSKLEFHAIDLWELYFDQLTNNENVLNQAEKLPDQEQYNYYGVKVHKSRVMIMKGIKAPSFIRPRLRGWGVSAVETLVRSINQYLKTNDLTFEVLDEFKLDIFKIKNLTNILLSKDGTQKIQQRVQLANMQKNYNNALTMDAEDDYDHKELSFAGLSDVMEGIRMQVASDVRMPLTKLFGISAQGFSSGQDDIENYNAMVESQVRQKLKFHIVKMVKLRCQRKFGMIPDDLSITFKSLRILSAQQEEEVKTLKFNRVLAAATAGLLDSKKFAEACNKDMLLPVQLDEDADDLMIDEELGDGDAAQAEVPAGSKNAKPRQKRVAKDAPEAD